MKTILIVDDDVSIGNMLEEVLSREGYGVARAYSGTEALLYLKNQTPDLILLDLMLPGLNGEELLPQIKNLPVIVVSAKTDVCGKVELLRGGAADYITKPFDTQELLARIEVQMRTKVSACSSVLRFDGIQMDLLSHCISVNDIPIHLTKTEYAILKLLLQNPSQVITKSVMLEEISADTPDCVETSLKVHISNLRRKLKEDSDRDYIESVWGIGFKLREDS